MRKPLGMSTAEQPLSCWGWHIGSVPSLHYGAHDFVRSDNTFSRTAMQHEVTGIDEQRNATWTHRRGEPASLHFEALVVNQTHALFYQDARLVAAHPLVRPVTDCTGEVLEMGGNDLQFGDVTFCVCDACVIFCSPSCF